jgi:hypothetical protein
VDIRKYAVSAIAHVLQSAEIGLSIGDPRVDVDDTAGAVIVRLPEWSEEDPEIVEETRQAAMGWMPFGVKLEIDMTPSGSDSHAPHDRNRVMVRVTRES